MAAEHLDLVVGAYERRAGPGGAPYQRLAARAARQPGEAQPIPGVLMKPRDADLQHWAARR